MIIHGDSLEKLKLMKENSVDAVVTDPPYGLSFMQARWDYDVPKAELWREVLRVLKPGGHLLSFGGTRTYHRMVVEIEDAGFEIRDQIAWLYGQGFPKSHNLKDEWAGWGSALKPSIEPIVVARKPLEKGLTIAENVIKWGCGAINIDGTRVQFANEQDKKTSARPGHEGKRSSANILDTKPLMHGEQSSLGRWPANIILDEFNEDVLILKDNLSKEVYKLIQRFFYDYSEMSDLRHRYSNLPEQKKSNKVLQQNVLLQGADIEAISNVREEAYSQVNQQNEIDEPSQCKIRQGKSDLQGVFHESRLSDDTYVGDSRARENAIQGNVHDDGQNLLCGTSDCDGKVSRTPPGKEGSGSSHERSKDRQSNRKSRTSLSKLSQERALGSVEGTQSSPFLIRESDVPEMWREYFAPSGLEVRSKYCAAEMLDAQSGQLKSGGQNYSSKSDSMFGTNKKFSPSKWAGDSGGASRFFYVAKASKSERGDGNVHPTVKPVKLMQYLIKLVTPPKGTVLDPFAGSGSTGVAAKSLGFGFIGIELNEEYVQIAKARMKTKKLIQRELEAG